MTSTVLEEFGKALIESVRDQAVRTCDLGASDGATFDRAKRWSDLLQNSAEKSRLLETIVPDCIDTTIACLLDAIDKGQLRLAYRRADGTLVDLTDEGMGELTGWFMGTDGWRNWYARERFFDDFAD